MITTNGATQAFADDSVAGQIARRHAVLLAGERALSVARLRQIEDLQTRLGKIEAAAHRVLASGQARYDAEERYAGDLVPAAAMAAMRSAMERAGSPSASMVHPDDLADRILRAFAAAGDEIKAAEAVRSEAAEEHAV